MRRDQGDTTLVHYWSIWSRQGRPGPPISYCTGSAEGRHVAEAGEHGARTCRRRFAKRTDPALSCLRSF